MKFTVKEYAKVKNISESYVYKLIRDNKIKSKIENSVKYILDETIVQNCSELNDEKTIEEPYIAKGEVRFRTSSEPEFKDDKNVNALKIEKKALEGELLVVKLENEKNKELNQNYQIQIEDLKKEKEELKYQVKDKDLNIKQLLSKLENLNDRVIGLIEWKNKSWWQRILGK